MDQTKNSSYNLNSFLFFQKMVPVIFRRCYHANLSGFNGFNYLFDAIKTGQKTTTKQLTVEPCSAFRNFGVLCKLEGSGVHLRK